MARELYLSLEDPPSMSMFAKAGVTTPKRDKSGTVQVLTDVAMAIANASSPQGPNSSPFSSGRLPSPTKMIEGQVKCYKQLS